MKATRSAPISRFRCQGHRLRQYRRLAQLSSSKTRSTSKMRALKPAARGRRPQQRILFSACALRTNPTKRVANSANRRDQKRPKGIQTMTFLHHSPQSSFKWSPSRGLRARLQSFASKSTSKRIIIGASVPGTKATCTICTLKATQMAG